MPLNLVKMAVGIDSVGHLRAVQRRRRVAAENLGGEEVVPHRTRFLPKRAGEILASGGSLYWIVRGYVRARQRIRGFHPAIDPDGRRFVYVQLDPEIVKTVPKPRDPQQGWRYLKGTDAPPDLAAAPEGAEEMPAELVAELRELGLL